MLLDSLVLHHFASVGCVWPSWCLCSCLTSGLVRLGELEQFRHILFLYGLYKWLLWVSSQCFRSSQFSGFLVSGRLSFSTIDVLGWTVLFCECLRTRFQLSYSPAFTQFTELYLSLNDSLLKTWTQSQRSLSLVFLFRTPLGKQMFPMPTL